MPLFPQECVQRAVVEIVNILVGVIQEIPLERVSKRILDVDVPVHQIQERVVHVDAFVSVVTTFIRVETGLAGQIDGGLVPRVTK